jgi:hypothetical protein
MEKGGRMKEKLRAGSGEQGAVGREKARMKLVKREGVR